MDTFLILFPSVHFALKAERAFRKQKVTAEMVPVPRAISSDCGICARVSAEELATVTAIFERQGVDHDAIYCIRNQRFIRQEPADIRKKPVDKPEKHGKNKCS